LETLVTRIRLTEHITTSGKNYPIDSYVKWYSSECPATILVEGFANFFVTLAPTDGTRKRRCRNRSNFSIFARRGTEAEFGQKVLALELLKKDQVL
jgi:hypothetical protein